MDTREQSGKKDHILREFSLCGIRVVRSKLFCGDWTRLDNQTVCVDTKTVGLQEVYGNLIGKQHKRFREECERAREYGIRLVVLVEDEKIAQISEVHTWENPRIAKYEKLKADHEAGKHLDWKLPSKPPCTSEILQKTMQTMSNRYGVEWEFCKRRDTARRILQILGVWTL